MNAVLECNDQDCDTEILCSKPSSPLRVARKAVACRLQVRKEDSFKGAPRALAENCGRSVKALPPGENYNTLYDVLL